MQRIKYCTEFKGLPADKSLEFFKKMCPNVSFDWWIGYFLNLPSCCLKLEEIILVEKNTVFVMNSWNKKPIFREILKLLFAGLFVNWV